MDSEGKKVERRSSVEPKADELFADQIKTAFTIDDAVKTFGNSI